MAGLQEDPGVNRGIVTASAIAIVVVMLGVWLLSVQIVRSRPGPLAAPVTPPGVPPDYGMLEQKQFTESNAGIEMVEQQQQLLQGYGWNEASHRAARVPIWRAEQLLLARGVPDAGR
jgi:hypothetical protein